MEQGSATFLPADGEVFGTATAPEPSIKTEPAIELEELVGVSDHSSLNYGGDSDHSDTQTSDLAGQEESKDRKSEGGERGVLCHLCSKIYKNKGSLATHLRVKHNLCGFTRAKMPCLEAGCDFRANRIARLITHLIQAHQMKFQCEKVTFQQKDDFWKWRKEAEERCRSSYCAETSAKTMVSGDVKFFLRCRRSGYVKCQPGGGRGRGSKKGSMKINGVCTSFIEVTFPREGGATVHFCRTHYGHLDDGQHLRMNAEERESIRELILQGHTASSIIATMKTKMPAHRHHLLKYANIRNISVRQNLFMTRGRGLAGGSRRVFPGRALAGVALAGLGQDSSLSLEVEKEVEVKAEEEGREVSCQALVLEADPEATTLSGDLHNPDLLKLREEVQAKIERVSCLASSLASGASLRRLSHDLDHLTTSLENEVHIEVIPEPNEPSDTNQQNVVFHKDNDGNTVLLLCSNKSFDDLVETKKYRFS